MQGRRTLCPAAFISCHISPLVVDNNSRAIHLICLAAIPSHPLPFPSPLSLTGLTFYCTPQKRQQRRQPKRRNNIIVVISWPVCCCCCCCSRPLIQFSRRRTWNQLLQSTQWRRTRRQGGRGSLTTQKKRRKEEEKCNWLSMPIKLWHIPATHREELASQSAPHQLLLLYTRTKSEFSCIYLSPCHIDIDDSDGGEETNEQAVWQNLINFPPDA